MRKSSQPRWSLTRSYCSAGNASSAVTERFLQSLRKQSVKPTLIPLHTKEKGHPPRMSPSSEIGYFSKKSLKLPGQLSARRPLELRKHAQKHKNGLLHKACQEQNKINRLKYKFQRAVNKKDCLSGVQPVTQGDIALAISGMGILPTTHKHFKGVLESVVQIMGVASRTPSAINLFCVLLGFLNIEVGERQLSWMMLPQLQREGVIRLCKEQTLQMHRTYLQLKGTRNESRNPLIISITLPNKEKEDNVFSGREDFKEIAESLMCRYNIPPKKRKNMERLVFCKLSQTQLM